MDNTSFFGLRPVFYPQMQRNSRTKQQKRSKATSDEPRNRTSTTLPTYSYPSHSHTTRPSTHLSRSHCTKHIWDTRQGHPSGTTTNSATPIKRHRRNIEEARRIVRQNAKEIDRCRHNEPTPNPPIRASAARLHQAAGTHQPQNPPMIQDCLDHSIVLS